MPTSGSSLSIASGAIVGVFVGVAAIALMLLVFVIIVVANRAEPDPRGLRALSVYLFSMTFVMLQIAYVGAVLIVTSLFSLVGPHDTPLTNGVARAVVIGGLLLVVAGITMAVHLRKGLEIARGDGRVDGPNARILRTYVSVVTFLYLVTMIVTLVVSIYFVFELAGPGVFGGGGSRSAIVQNLLDTLYVMVAAGLIVVAHAKLAPSIFHFRRTAAPQATAGPAVAE